MFEFSQYFVGFTFLTILTMGFWLCFFWLVSYPIGRWSNWEAIKEKKSKERAISLV
jgi:hypothetical protein